MLPYYDLTNPTSCPRNTQLPYSNQEQRTHFGERWTLAIEKNGAVLRLNLRFA